MIPTAKAVSSEIFVQKLGRDAQKSWFANSSSTTSAASYMNLQISAKVEDW